MNYLPTVLPTLPNYQALNEKNTQKRKNYVFLMYSFEKKANFNKTKYDVSDTVFLTVTKLLCCMMLMESLTFEHVAKIIQVISVLEIPY